MVLRKYPLMWVHWIALFHMLYCHFSGKLWALLGTKSCSLIRKYLVLLGAAGDNTKGQVYREDLYLKCLCCSPAPRAGMCQGGTCPADRFNGAVVFWSSVCASFQRGELCCPGMAVIWGWSWPSSQLEKSVPRQLTQSCVCLSAA